MVTNPRRLLAAALLLAAVLCNGAIPDFDGGPFRNFPQGPFPTGIEGFPFSGASAGRFGMPDWTGGNWMPGFPNAGNGGFGVPGAGFPGAGAWRPSVVCSERGPCFRKRLTCPAKCFASYSRHSKSFVGGGGGGGCTFDCRRRCTAYC